MLKEIKAVRIQLVSLFLLVNLISFSQEMKAIKPDVFVTEFKAVVEKLNQGNSMMRYKKEVYNDVKSKQLLSTTNGCMYYGTGKSYRVEEGAMLVIQTSDLNLVVDSNERTVIVSKPDTTFNPMMAVSNLSEKNLNNFNLFMHKAEAYTQFKVVPKNDGESTIELFIDNKTKHLYKLSITFSPANYFSEDINDESIEQPFVLMIYEPMTSIKNTSKLFETKEILVPVEKGRFNLTPSYSDFKLHDSRYEPTKI